MSRILIVIIIFIVIYLLLKHYRKQTPKKDGEDTSKHRENMVRCAHCGVHLPKGESIMVDHKHYCSEVHRHAHTSEPE